MKNPRFNPFPQVSGKYGAPMGRRDTAPQPFPADMPLCVSHPQGEYDSGGAYWGLGGSEGPVYAVWPRGRGKTEGVRYVRARGKAEAMKKATEDFCDE